MTITDLKNLRESEDHVEFKSATRNFPFSGGSSHKQTERRKCVLGYVVALSNEGGGMLVLGMSDKHPHQVVGTDFAKNKVGEKVDNIYSELQIRVETQELHENGKRVLVIKVPKRPIGKPLKFEGVALMRIGDSLRNMSDEEMLKILLEQEPDFSAKICKGLKLDDLDATALNVLKTRYAEKTGNVSFKTLSDQQVLSDLELISNDQLTYAALILVGKKQALKKHLPQAKVILEYRNTASQIPHDRREEVDEPLYVGLDKIWTLIQTRNSSNHISKGPYINDVPVFDETVIREALLNSIAHRDYSLTSEIVIRQSPKVITINNPGGFPKGVNLENLITISSTPRSRLLSDVLLKTGLVERSGQGVDKIFSITLAQGKPEPDYSHSDPFQVSLTLNGSVIDEAFYLFNKIAGEKLTGDQQLGVHDVIALAKIRDGHSIGLDPEVLSKLDRNSLVSRTGTGKSQKYVLGEDYQTLVAAPLLIGSYRALELTTLIEALSTDKEVRIGSIVNAFNGKLTREQVKYLVEKLVEDKVIERVGTANRTTYNIQEQFKESKDQLKEIEEYLNQQHQD
ncbi:MAG: AAA family ATPase [Chryseobacterium sp.]|nr:MAG: AAA family ATPase [Chryseobacterium sp.]